MTQPSKFEAAANGTDDLTFIRECENHNKEYNTWLLDHAKHLSRTVLKMAKEREALNMRVRELEFQLANKECLHTTDIRADERAKVRAEVLEKIRGKFLTWDTRHSGSTVHRHQCLATDWLESEWKKDNKNTK